MIFWVSTFYFQIFEAAFKLRLAMRTLALHLHTLQLYEVFQNFPDPMREPSGTATAGSGRCLCHLYDCHLYVISVLFQALLGSL